MENIETERKFIIKNPDFARLSKRDGFTESDIIQIYISDNEATHRVRKRTYKGQGSVYTENIKRRINSLSSYEHEREISASRFEELALQMEKGAHPLVKTRRTFAFLGKIFEIDSYPEWENTSIMEIELKSETDNIEFPPFIEIIKEVTGDRAYSNHSMAHNMPLEDSI